MKSVIRLSRVVKMLAITCMVLGAVPLLAFTAQNGIYVAQQFCRVVHTATAYAAPYIAQFG